MEQSLGPNAGTLTLQINDLFQSVLNTNPILLQLLKPDIATVSFLRKQANSVQGLSKDEVVKKQVRRLGIYQTYLTTHFDTESTNVAVTGVLENLGRLHEMATAPALLPLRQMNREACWTMTTAFEVAALSMKRLITDLTITNEDESKQIQEDSEAWETLAHKLSEVVSFCDSYIQASKTPAEATELSSPPQPETQASPEGVDLVSQASKTPTATTKLSPDQQEAPERVNWVSWCCNGIGNALRGLFSWLASWLPTGRQPHGT